MKGLAGERVRQYRRQRRGSSLLESILASCKLTDTINSLTDEYQNYCARHGLPLLSANELLGQLTELDDPSEARRERISTDDAS